MKKEVLTDKFIFSIPQGPRSQSRKSILVRTALLEHERNMQWKSLDTSKKDAEKTALKARCNQIMNILGIVDPKLEKHLRSIELQPIILFVRWIRCFFAREACLSSVYCIWDFLLADTNNQFANMDFLCLALI